MTVRIALTAMIVACGATLSGCASQPNEPEFNARIALARKDPVAYKKEFDECMQKSAPNATQKQLELLGALVNAPADRAVQVSCERLTKAVVDGRITYKQYIAQSKGSVDPQVIRVLRGG